MATAPDSTYVADPARWRALSLCLVTGFMTLLDVSIVNVALPCGAMLQTAQRVGSAVGVAVVLAQFYSALSGSGGDYATSLQAGLRTTIGLVTLGLAFGVLDLASPRRASK